uniref:Uncharacterized protein n=1 Tax=Mus musculus TaxID=10090 RepID=Q8C1L3_MOUSE|nr:unnamed protein product [Mus musculus]
MAALRQATAAARCRCRQPQPFLLACLHGGAGGPEPLSHFEVEVCQLPRPGLRGVLFRRVAATPWPSAPSSPASPTTSNSEPPPPLPPPQPPSQPGPFFLWFLSLPQEEKRTEERVPCVMTEVSLD